MRDFSSFFKKHYLDWLKMYVHHHCPLWASLSLAWTTVIGPPADFLFRTIYSGTPLQSLWNASLILACDPLDNESYWALTAPGIVLSTLNSLSHLILVTIPWGNLHFTEKQREAQSG